MGFVWIGGLVYGKLTQAAGGDIMKCFPLDEDSSSTSVIHNKHVPPSTFTPPQGGGSTGCAPGLFSFRSSTTKIRSVGMTLHMSVREMGDRCCLNERQPPDLSSICSLGRTSSADERPKGAGWDQRSVSVSRKSGCCLSNLIHRWKSILQVANSRARDPSAHLTRLQDLAVSNLLTTL